MFSKDKRLVMAVSVLLVTGFLLTSLASYYISVGFLRDHVVRQELPLTGDTIYSEIQRDLSRPVFIASLMASDTFLRDWVLEGEGDPAEITRYLAEIKQRYGAFTAFFVSDRTGNYYHAGGVLKQVAPDEPRDAWYFRVRDMAEPYEINVDPDLSNDDALTVFVNYRVFDYAGRFIGATGVGLDVEAVKAMISRYGAAYDRRILFVDRAGKVPFGTPAGQDGRAWLGEIRERLLSGAEGQAVAAPAGASLHYRLADPPLLVNARYIEEFDWYLLVVQDDVHGSGPLFDTLLVNLAVCALITLVVLMVTHYTIRSYQADLERLASHDKLTSVYNRQAFEVLFQQWLAEVRRESGTLAVILFDIDLFKEVNDRYGHLVGDAVLRHVAGIVRSRLRETDVISRWGGEEFMVLVKNCSLASASSLAEELRLAVLNHPAVHGEASIPVTLSAGVAEYRQGDGEDDLIGRADRALYEAKRRGRNQVSPAAFPTSLVELPAGASGTR